MREMKDSGIEWVGQVPNNWKLKKGKYLFKQHNNRGNLKCLQLLSPSQKFGVIPQTLLEELTTQNVVKVSEKANLNDFKTVHVGDFCISLRSFQGGFEYSRYEGVVSPAYQIFSAIGDNLCDGYYRYLFKDKSFIDKMNSYTMTLRDGKNIAFDDFGNTYIPVPPKSEQEKIANFLDSKCSEIDAISADIQKEIEILEQYKRSVITEAVTKGLNPDAEMKDSGVAWCPQIPSHWQYSNPKGLFGLRTDRAFRDDRQLTASQEYGIVYQDEYMEKTGNKVVTVTKDFSILKHVEPDDFVISMRSFQGGLEYSDKQGCISSAYVMLIPNKEFVYAPFYRWFFKSSKYINALQSTSNLVRDGQAMRYANFVKVPLFIVPIEEQKAIASYLDEKIEKVNSILAEKKKQLEILSNYKKSLIYEYVTGKKEVLT